MPPRVLVAALVLCAACEAALGLDRAHLAPDASAARPSDAGTSPIQPVWPAGLCAATEACGWPRACAAEISDCLNDDQCRVAAGMLERCLVNPKLEACDGATCLERFGGAMVSDAIETLRSCLVAGGYAQPGCAAPVASRCQMLCSCMVSPTHCAAKALQVWKGNTQGCLEQCAGIAHTDSTRGSDVLPCRITHCEVASPLPDRAMHCDHAWPEPAQHAMCGENDAPRQPPPSRCMTLNLDGYGCELGSDCCSGNCPASHICTP